jgi:hypothetical protein
VADLSTQYSLRPSDVGYAQGSELYAREANSSEVVKWSEDKPLLLKVIEG